MIMAPIFVIYTFVYLDKSHARICRCVQSKTYLRLVGTDYMRLSSIFDLEFLAIGQWML